MLGLPNITETTYPYIATFIFIIILSLRGLEYSKSGKVKDAEYTKFHPYIVQWLIKHKLGFMVPVMNLFGVSQFTAPNKYTGGLWVIIVSIGILLFLLFISELWYGHFGFLLLFLAAIMIGPFLDTLQSYNCLDGESLNLNKNFCCGTLFIVFLAATCINIFSSGGTFGIILGCVLHLIAIGGLITLDYFTTFKKINEYRLCLSSMHHTMAYILGFLVSFLMLGFAYSTVLSFQKNNVSQSI